jgi:diacylglycerol kinase family enzyme
LCADGVTPRIPLGILPLGTGNDFARSIGIPVDPDAAVARIERGRIRSFDLVEANGRLFCTVGLLGIPAASAETITRLTAAESPLRPVVHALGGWSYRLAGLGHVLLQRDLRCAIRIASAERRHHQLTGGHETATYGVFVANTRFLGGGLELPVSADAADGFLDLATVRAHGRFRLLWAFLCFAHGWRVPSDTLDVQHLAEATLTTAVPTSLSADGEHLTAGTTFHFRVRPRALRVFV